MPAVEPAAQPVPESRKFLVVVDQTPECQNALRYAARRAAKTGSGVMLLYVAERPEFQQFAGIEQVMREEAHAEAQQVLRELATRIKADAGIERPRSRLGVAFQHLDGLIEALAVAEMIGRRAGQHGILGVGVEREEKAAVDFRPDRSVIRIMPATGKRCE